MVSKFGISKLPGGPYFQGLLLLVSGRVNDILKQDASTHGFITPKGRRQTPRLGRGLFDVNALPLMLERPPLNRKNSYTSPRLHPKMMAETNISPENRPLEKEIPIGNHHFSPKTHTPEKKNRGCNGNLPGKMGIYHGLYKC